MHSRYFISIPIDRAVSRFALRKAQLANRGSAIPTFYVADRDLLT